MQTVPLMSDRQHTGRAWLVNDIQTRALGAPALARSNAASRLDSYGNCWVIVPFHEVFGIVARPDRTVGPLVCLTPDIVDLGQ